MCNLIACETGKPDPTVLDRSHAFNPHGAGVAWINEKGRVCWVKGIKSVEEVKEMVNDLPLPMLIHFRLASAGGRDRRLTHPFPVNARGQNGLEMYGNAKRVLAHNGTIENWKVIAAEMAKTFKRGFPGPPLWSDTRLMAMAEYYSHKSARRLARGQKVAILDGEEGLKVWNQKLWAYTPEETGGYWQSHSLISRWNLTGQASRVVTESDLRVEQTPLWGDIPYSPTRSVEPTHGELAAFDARDYERAKGIHGMTDDEWMRWQEEAEINAR